MTLLDLYTEEKKRFLENCTQCGLCAKGCPILPYTDTGKIPFKDIQKSVFDFMRTGQPQPLAYTKAFACMECFKCTAGMCPEGLNPMRVNETIKGEYIRKGWAEGMVNDAGRTDRTHRVCAAIQTTRDEYHRITTESGSQESRYLFFPGCNVYLQPEKILLALDLLDVMGCDYAYLPGLSHCCGNERLFAGEIEKGSQQTEGLMETISRYTPETVVLWCPTCHCRFETDLASGFQLPYKVLSFPQFLAENLDRLSLTDAAAGRVTLHEPCKSAYTGADPDGARRVLNRLPGITIKEMPHHGEDTLCCGSGAIAWFSESCVRFRNTRLEEAAVTGADRLVTVCHYCNQTFAAEVSGYGFSVTNYIHLAAQAAGIPREDRFGKYIRWNDPQRILLDTRGCAAESLFPKRRISEVVQSVFIH